MFCYGDDDAGEDFIVDFDYPEEEITSFQVLLEKVAAKADEEQEWLRFPARNFLLEILLIKFIFLSLYCSDKDTTNG